MPPESPIPGPSHLDADACIDLVSGLLAPEERREALAHTARCADCEALLRTVAATHERGRARAPEVLAGEAQAAAGDPLSAGDDRREPDRKEIVPTRDDIPRLTTTAGGTSASGTIAARGTGRPARSRRQLGLAAASVLVVFGAAWILTNRAGLTRRGGQPEFVRLPRVEAARLAEGRGGPETDSLVLRGIAAYQRQDFATAQRLLAVTQADRGMELMRQVFLASVQVRRDSPESALVTLQRVRPQQLPEPWRSESEWTRLVALSRTGRRASADSLLDLLAQGVGPVQDRARRLRAGNRPNP